MLPLFVLASLAGSVPARVPHCSGERVENGIKVIDYRGDRTCIAFGPPRRFRGIWLASMEGFDFVEGTTTIAQAKARSRKVWLTIDQQSLVTPDLRRPHIGHAYRVSFIGRAAIDMHRKPPDGYGHMGMSSGLVLVDRMLVAKDLGPIP
jgi:hypothetical protein